MRTRTLAYMSQCERNYAYLVHCTNISSKLKATENPTKALATSDGCARANSSAYDFMARCAVERIVIRFKLDSREHDVVREQHEHGGLVHKDEIIIRHRDVRQRRQTRRYFKFQFELF